jgi:voltage-gated potassium channel
MENTGENDRSPLLVSISGLLTVVLGLILIFSPPVYILKVISRTFIEYEKDFSIFTIIAGLILIRNGFSLRGHRKRTWIFSFTLIIIVTLLLGFNSLTVFIPILIGIFFNVYVIYRLLKARNFYRFPSTRLINIEFAASFITIVFTLSYGIAGTLFLGSSFDPPILNAGQAIYFTGETVTTLGFGDILPVTLTARLFTISLAVLGIASFFGAMVILISPIIERRIGGLVEVLKKQQLKGLKNYTLVCGFSGYISEYLKDVKAKGGVVIIMTRDQRIIDPVKESGFLILEENPADENSLKDFNFSDAKSILVASEDDGQNLMIAASFFQLSDQETLRKKITILVKSPDLLQKFKVFQYRVMDIYSIVGNYIFSKEPES